VPPQPDVDARIDALYAGPLDEFVAGRDALAKEVAGDGDRVGSARITKLRRPTVAAWAVNQVARTRPDDVATLAALGDELRAATADRDRGRIKALDHLRRERTEALVGSLREAGDIAGRPLSADMLDRIAETLTAVVLDEDAAAVVRAGRLTQALQYVGFGIVDEGGEEADVVALRASAPEPEGDALAAAARQVEETAAELDRLEARHEEAQSAARRAAGVVEKQEAELERINAELKRLAEEREAAQRAREEAQRAAEEAEREVVALEDELDAAEERAAAARRARRAARRG